jgi:hypothetical protein
METFKWILITTFFLEVVGCIMLIGEEREIITKRRAVGQVIWAALFISGIIYFFK